MNARTFQVRPRDVHRKWVLLDASEAPLGRLATHAATYLVGKHKPAYSPHIDSGDHVVVINADKIRLTGDKEASKLYRRHSQYPGSLKERSLTQQRALDSRKVVIHAVRGMLPKNKLMSGRLMRLHVTKGHEHPYEGQKPVKTPLGQEK